ncbi:MAG: DNA translocase FtsK, partial [Patescibacteria group bacterium]|nr:DNA translocase FtsK [Patescibacteria group bacterium]
MAKKKNQKKIKNKKIPRFFLPEEIKRYFFGIVFFLLALIFVLSLFGKAGIAGKLLFRTFYSLIGKALFILPLILVLAGFVFFFSQYRKIFWPLVLAISASLFGLSGILECLTPSVKQGGFLGEILTFHFFKFFGFLVTEIVFFGIILIGVLIFWYLLKRERKPSLPAETPAKVGLIRRIFTPSFKIKEVPPLPSEKTAPAEPKIRPKEVPFLEIPKLRYEMPPLELLDADKGIPSAGDIRQNSAIIKKTLENFGIPVKMGEVNTGPTVTQYTLKPAEGIKLSKITALSNDLALALASHPIRIEAPIPGKSLVGIEVPNKTRTLVRLKNLISLPQFQSSSSNLTFVLGRDVSGNPIFSDLARMPHLL